MSVSIAEEEIRGIGPEILAGHLAVWNYFQTTDTPEKSKKFVDSYKKAYGQERVTDDPIEAAYFAVYLWAEAVKKRQGHLMWKKVKAAADGIEFKAPGGTVKIDGATQHTWKNCSYRGNSKKDGQFKEIWNSGKAIQPDPYLKGYTWGKNLN
ncbi:hypothetical protein GCM10020331_064710 [Ectobacillus funiculus]